MVSTSGRAGYPPTWLAGSQGRAVGPLPLLQRARGRFRRNYDQPKPISPLGSVIDVGTATPVGRSPAAVSHIHTLGDTGCGQVRPGYYQAQLG